MKVQPEDDEKMRIKKIPDTQQCMLKQLWELGLPTLIEEVLQIAVSYVDTVMVGAIGAMASATVGLTTTVVWLENGLFFAFGIGFLSHIARYIGAGESEKAHRTSIQSLWVVLILGIAETILFCGLAFQIPMWMQGSLEIQHNSGLYFMVISIPLIFRGATVILGTVLRANHDTKTPMLVNLCVNILNIVLNQLLIGNGLYIHLCGGDFYIPAAGLGTFGAAIATAVSVTIGGIIIGIAFVRNPLTTPIRYGVRFDFQNIYSVTRTSVPLMGERIVMGVGYVVFGAQVATLGTVATAAHAIALTIEQAFYIPGYGMQTAFSTLCGNAAGRKDREELKQVIKAGTISTVSIMTIMSLFLFWGSTFCMSFFTPSKEVVELGAVVLKMIAVSEPFFAVLIIFEGLFHGVGETKFPFWIAVFTMWGIRNGGTWICLHMIRRDLIMIWLCMIIDNLTRCLFLGLLYVFGRWRKELGLN